MAISVKNIQTGEVTKVKNTGMTTEGRMYVFGKSIPTRWAEKHPEFRLTGEILGEGAYNKYEVTINEGWEVVTGERKQRAPRAPKQQPAPEAPVTAQQPEPQQEEPVNINKPAAAVTSPSDNVDETAQVIASLLRRVKKTQSASVDVETVRAVVAEEFDKRQPKQQELIVKSPKGDYKVKGVTHEKFADICTLVQAGVDVYLHGDAGTGKSQLAEQVGEALGLKVYQIGAVKDVYQLRGYGDANGKYVPSSFYQAFTEGGLLIIDEADAMDAEASLELNGALAQRRFDFPIIGNVTAHADFHVIMTGNTVGMGATEGYAGRTQLDAALLNRVFMVEIDYSEKIERAIAGDENADMVELIHDLRAAAKAAGVLIVVSYRNLEQLRKLYGLVGIQTLMHGCITKGISRDEINILYNGLNNKANKWAKFFKEAA